MSRRVPVGDEPIGAQPVGSGGAHRPESIAGRLSDQITDSLHHLATLEQHMSASWTDILARLDSAAAAAVSIRDTAASDMADQVDQRVQAIEVALGIHAPVVVDPPVDGSV